MNDARLPHEIDALGRFLDFAYLPRTADLVRRLAKADLRGAEFDTWLLPIVEEYRREVVDSLNFLGEPDTEHHKRLLHMLDSVVGGALRYPKEFFAFMLSARPIVEVIGESHGNTREMYRSIISHVGSKKHAFLTICLMYLILCEGVLRNQARLLLGLRAVGEGDARATSFLLKPVSQKVLEQTLQDPDLGVCADGYHRHVRNAIAHGHMRFIPATEEMRFRDFDAASLATPIFEETWEFARLARAYAKLDDTYLVISTYLQIHFLPALVPGKATDPMTN